MAGGILRWSPTVPFRAIGASGSIKKAIARPGSSILAIVPDGKQQTLLALGKRLVPQAATR